MNKENIKKQILSEKDMYMTVLNELLKLSLSEKRLVINKVYNLEGFSASKKADSSYRIYDNNKGYSECVDLVFYHEKTTLEFSHLKKSDRNNDFVLHNNGDMPAHIVFTGANYENIVQAENYSYGKEINIPEGYKTDIEQEIKIEQQIINNQEAELETIKRKLQQKVELKEDMDYVLDFMKNMPYQLRGLAGNDFNKISTFCMAYVKYKNEKKFGMVKDSKGRDL